MISLSYDHRDTLNEFKEAVIYVKRRSVVVRLLLDTSSLLSQQHMRREEEMHFRPGGMQPFCKVKGNSGLPHGCRPGNYVNCFKLVG